jgi:xanthine dehydrogenase accessory factor
MKEFENIITAFRQIKQKGGYACLATIVRTQGSTYRRPGARTLITEEGDAIGTISGGCLDTDLLDKAKGVLSSGEPTLVTYDSTSPDDIVWGLALGCRGRVDVLLERLPQLRKLDPLEVLSQCRENRKECVSATLFRVTGGWKSPIGSRLFLCKDDVFASDIADLDLVTALHQSCRTVRTTRQGGIEEYRLPAGSAEAFIELISSPVSLLLFGAGADAIPLVQFAKDLGWQVTVVDGREAYLQRARFPQADRLVLATPDEILRQFSPHDYDVAVVMSHNYNHDLEIVKALLPSSVRYLGLLGPQSKGEMILQQLQDGGYTTTKKDLDRFFNPAGIDAGAETPEEIALAILTEIQAVLTGHTAGFLRQRVGPIHPAHRTTVPLEEP